MVNFPLPLALVGQAFQPAGGLESPPYRGGDLNILPPCGGGKGGGAAYLKPKRRFQSRAL
jgi:hypothetical protein